MVVLTTVDHNEDDEAGGSARSAREVVHCPSAMVPAQRVPACIGLARNIGPRAHVRAAFQHLRAQTDRGLATAEYAIATIAAAGFAGLLILVLKSGAVRGLLDGIIKSALNV